MPIIRVVSLFNNKCFKISYSVVQTDVGKNGCWIHLPREPYESRLALIGLKLFWFWRKVNTTFTRTSFPVLLSCTNMSVSVISLDFSFWFFSLELQTTRHYTLVLSRRVLCRAAEKHRYLHSCRVFCPGQLKLWNIFVKFYFCATHEENIFMFVACILLPRFKNSNLYLLLYLPSPYQQALLSHECYGTCLD